MRIRRAGPGDIDAVCRFLHDHMNPKIAPDRWRRLMSYDWLPDKPDLGRIAEVDGRLVGYVGAIYADRTIGGRVERVVNITSWYLAKAFRGAGAGAALMAAATEDPDATYTLLTNSSRTVDLVQRLGFRLLDDRRYEWRAGGGAGGAAPLLVEDPAAIAAACGETQRRLLRDHAALPVRPVLLRDGATHCLMVFSIKRKGADVTHFDVLHLSDATLFAGHAQAIADALLPPGDAVLAAESRFLHGAAVDAPTRRLAVPHFYKSRRLDPWQVDHLYSELQLLDLKLA